MTAELTDEAIAAFKVWLQDELTHAGVLAGLAAKVVTSTATGAGGDERRKRAMETLTALIERDRSCGEEIDRLKLEREAWLTTNMSLHVELEALRAVAREARKLSNTSPQYLTASDWLDLEAALRGIK